MTAVPHKFFAVYNADGSIAGELGYLFDKLRGAAQCPLCDVSHGWNPVGRKAWRNGRDGLCGLVWLHRDEQPEPLKAFTEGQLPAVVLEDAAGFHILMDADSLAACAGDFTAFEREFLARVDSAIGGSMTDINSAANR